LQDGLVILIEGVMEDDDASAPSSPLRPATASGVDIFLVHPSAPSLSPSLSPFAPFHPRDGALGRPKARRWADEDSEVEGSPVSFPTSYLDAVHLGSQVRALPLIGGSCGSVAAERGKRPPVGPPIVAGGAHGNVPGAGMVHGRRRCRARRQRPRPELVHSLPARPVEGRIPARQRLGRCERGSACQRFSAPDAGGWNQVLSLESVHGAGGARPARPASATQWPPAVIQRICKGSASTASPPPTGSNLLTATTLPPLQGVLAPRAGLQAAT
jgi:hypothetical protein